MGVDINKNNIYAKPIKSFNRQILSVFIDDCPLGEYLSRKTGEPFYKDLWSAWLLNDRANNDQYIWTLINEKMPCNLPILLCPDDMDFWCTVIVAKIKFENNTVIWGKIGVLRKFGVSLSFKVYLLSPS